MNSPITAGDTDLSSILEPEPVSSEVNTDDTDLSATLEPEQVPSQVNTDDTDFSATLEPEPASPAQSQPNLAPESVSAVQLEQSLAPFTNSLPEDTSNEMVWADAEPKLDGSDGQHPEFTNSQLDEESTHQTIQFERGDLVEVLIENKWVKATYIRRINMVYSHQTRKLEEGHQVSVTNGLGQTFYRVAITELRPWAKSQLR